MPTDFKHKSLKKKKMGSFYIMGAVCGLLFLGLLFVKIGFWARWSDSNIAHKGLESYNINKIKERDTWMNITQADRKIGYAHSRMFKEKDGFRIAEDMHLRINTMGLAQDILLKTVGHMNSDLTLASFEFEMDSGRFHFKMQGNWRDGGFEIVTGKGTDVHRIHIKLAQKPYLSAGIIDAARMAGIVPGKRFRFDVFDPATLGRVPVLVKVVGHERIKHAGQTEVATKLIMEFKGTTQTVWLNAAGELVKQKGILGLVLEKTSRNDALYGRKIQASQDLTRIAAIKPDKPINDSTERNFLVLSIDGLKPARITNLSGGRQRYKKGLLTIKKEDPTLFKKIGLSAFTQQTKSTELKKFLMPEPFIQSDHPEIKKLASKIVSKSVTPVDMARRIIEWIHQNIARRPVVSVPDALATLKNRVGDCNEHAVLLAALARAAGLPTKIEAGLVYVRGRFYYHAWNLLYLGQWVTADALFKQLPADVTHIRLVTGAQKDQLDILGLIGRINIKLIQ